MRTTSKKLITLLPLLLSPLSTYAQTMQDIIRITWNNAIRPTIIFMFVLATAVFIFGLIQFVANSDSEEARETGKRHLVYGLIGMAVMFSAGAILTVIANFVSSV